MHLPFMLPPIVMGPPMLRITVMFSCMVGICSCIKVWRCFQSIR